MFKKSLIKLKKFVVSNGMSFIFSNYLFENIKFLNKTSNNDNKKWLETSNYLKDLNIFKFALF